MAAIGRAIPERLLTRARRNEAGARAALAEVFESADVLLTPALAAPPVQVERWSGKGAIRTFNGVGMWTPYAAIWNVTGQPAAAIPAGSSGTACRSRSRSSDGSAATERC
jgi:amidase